MEGKLREFTKALRNAVDGDHIAVNSLQLVDEVTGNLEVLAAFRHPLGFLHVELTPLLRLPRAERLRLHIWPSTSYLGDPAGNIHDHTWSLTSVVLRGSLRDRNYEPIPCERGAYTGTRVVYGEQNAFVDDSRYSLEKVADRTVVPGQVYKVPARVVHRTDVTTAQTVTVVLAEETQDERGGPLLLHRDGAVVGTSVRARVSTAELSRELSAVRRLFESP
jgi:hypothetical protein